MSKQLPQNLGHGPYHIDPTITRWSDSFELYKLGYTIYCLIKFRKTKFILAMNIEAFSFSRCKWLN